MTSLSTLPILVVALAVFWLWLTVRSVRRGWIGPPERRAVILWLTVLGIWGFATSYLAISGAYEADTFFALLPGLWLPLVPAFVTAAMALSSKHLRTAFYQIAIHHRFELIFVQGVRIAALGGVYKALIGIFPGFFAYAVGVPDLLFGLSAIAFITIGATSKLTSQTLIAWNLVGIAVIFAAPFLIQMGLPGPFHIFTSLPDGRALFEFPMVLAPTLVVPLLITMNGIHAAALWLELRQERGALSNVRQEATSTLLQTNGRSK